MKELLFLSILLAIPAAILLYMLLKVKQYQDEMYKYRLEYRKWLESEIYCYSIYAKYTRKQISHHYL